MSKKSRNTKSSRTKVVAAEPGLLDRLPERTMHLIAIGFLIVVSLAFFSRFHFEGRAVAPSDSISWRASAESILEYQKDTGIPALWATNMFSGMPAYMISYVPRSIQADNLATWLRPVLWPSSHFIFMLLGMYVLVFLLTGNWIASLLSSIGFGLTTYLPLLIYFGHNSKFIALCFSPWLVVSFIYVIRNPGILGALLFAAAAAINLRSGHIQITYFYVVGVLVLWVGVGIHSYRSGSLPAFVKATGFLAVGSVVAVLMVAQPYLANAEYKELSIRGASIDSGSAAGLGWERAMLWSQGRAELLTLLIANAFGGGALYWGPKSFTAGPHYLGGIVIFLAVVAIVRRRDWVVLSATAAFLLMVAFSLGENLAIVNRLAFSILPLFSSFRAPETWLAAAAFFAALLGGLGLNEVIKVLRSGERVDRTVYTPLIAVAGLVVLLMVGKSTFFSFEKEGERARYAAQIASRQQVQANDPRVTQAVNQFVVGLQQDRMDAFQRDAIRTLLLLLLAGGLIYAASSRRSITSLAALGVVLLVLFDLFGVGRRYLSAENMVDAGSLTQQIPKYDFDDFILRQVTESGGPGHFRVLSLEGDPTTTARPSYYYESIGGYHGAKLRVYEEFLTNVVFADGLGAESVTGLDLLNVRYLIGRQALPGFRPVFTSEQTGLSVFRNDSDPGRAFFVDRIEGAELGDETWSRVTQPDFDPAELALVTPAAETKLSAILEDVDSTATSAVQLTQYGPREIVWEVDTSVDRLLVVSEIFYPKGWHASIDGEETPIYQVDGVLRGLSVSSGHHSVTMRFDPASDRIGGLVAAVSTAFVYAGIFGFLVVGFWRRRRDGSSGADGNS